MNLTLQTIATPISGNVTQAAFCFLCQLSDSGIIKERLGLVFYIRKYELLSCLKIRLKITREHISSRHHIMKEIYHFNMCLLLMQTGPVLVKSTGRVLIGEGSGANSNTPPVLPPFSLDQGLSWTISWKCQSQPFSILCSFWRYSDDLNLTL